MVIQSLGRRTDLIFARFAGQVVDRGHYTLIKTPNNPGYHWGNYIVFDHAPKEGSLKEWKEIFDSEFEYYTEPQHYVFTWDTGQTEPGEIKEFLDANFEFDSATVLTTKNLNPPQHQNDKIQIRKITSDKEWEEIVQLQTLCSDPKFFNEYYEQFKQKQMTNYRKMSEAGMGFWFGAYIEDTLVGDLGIFHEDGVARYQSVGTHPEFRRQGICGALVYQTGLIALNEFKADHLVMEADIHYHAARIYESVGFRRREINHALSWWKAKE